MATDLWNFKIWAMTHSVNKCYFFLLLPHSVVNLSPSYCFSKNARKPWSLTLKRHFHILSFNSYGFLIFLSFLTCQDNYDALAFIICVRVRTVVSCNSLHNSVQFSSVQSPSHVWLFATHGQQHARPLCPSPTPRACSNSCPLSWWRHPTISSSVIPFSSCLQSSTPSDLF